MSNVSQFRIYLKKQMAIILTAILTDKNIDQYEFQNMPML